jgi:ABC-type dipeptide/oligopeptide/nickel transport system permease component
MMGVVLVVGAAVIATNIVVDALYARVDPRIRLGSTS